MKHLFRFWEFHAKKHFAQFLYDIFQRISGEERSRHEKKKRSIKFFLVFLIDLVAFIFLLVFGEHALRCLLLFKFHFFQPSRKKSCGSGISKFKKSNKSAIALWNKKHLPKSTLLIKLARFFFVKKSCLTKSFQVLLWKMLCKKEAKTKQKGKHFCWF